MCVKRPKALPGCGLDTEPGAVQGIEAKLFGLPFGRGSETQ
ncbi:hypothetical protein FAGKG844_350044 [Frankia sp. AgKG'84/4]